tara:strand:+ start:325 stop:528 length:204 start_codon:yes stop_codon:yes gene_type:complete
MWQSAEQGIGLTLVSSRSAGQNPDVYNSDPSRVIENFMKRISPRIVVDHSYMPIDFLTVLLRDREER